MAVPELETFRQKYPDYHDMDDATLAGKLAAKYPDAYGDLPGKVTAATSAPKPVITPETELQAETAKMSGPKKFITGIGGGMVNLAHGVEQLGAEVGEKVGLVKPETVKTITDEGTADRKLMDTLKGGEKFYGPAHVGELVGESAPLATLPGGVGGSALKRAGTAALTGAGIGAAQFVAPGESRGMNTLTGAVGGAAGSAGLSAAGKVLNGLKGKVSDTVIQRLAKKWGVSTTLGEDLQNARLMKGETKSEAFPSFMGGLTGFRETQNKEAKTAAKSLLGKYVAGGGYTDDAMVANKALIDQSYDAAKAAARQSGIQAEANETRSSARELLRRFPNVFESIQDNDLKSTLRNIIGDTSAKPSTILNAQGKPVMVKPKFDFDTLWDLRTNLGTEVRDATSKTAHAQLVQMRDAVDNDIEKLLASGGNPEAMKMLREANKNFITYDVKYRIMQNAYNNALHLTKSGETGFFSPVKFQTELKNIVKKEYNTVSGKPNKNPFSKNEIQEMSGLANLMYTIRRAGQFKEDPPTGNRWGQLFPLVAVAGAGAEAFHLGGAVAGAGAEAFHLGGAVAVAKAAIGATVLGNAYKFLTTTATGKNLVRAASRVNSSNPRMQVMLNQIYNQLPKFMAKEGAKRGEQPPHEQEPTAPQPAAPEPSPNWSIGNE